RDPNPREQEAGSKEAGSNEAGGAYLKGVAMKASMQAARRKRNVRHPVVAMLGTALGGTVLNAGLVLLAVGIAPPALAQGQTANVKSMTATLNSSGARKECVTLTPHQRLRYWYRAEA